MRGITLDSRAVRRVWRYIVLVTAAALMTYGVFHLMPGRTVLERLSTATAYASLILLASALIIGPLNVLRAKPNPLSSYLRRDVGIVAASVGLMHVIFGLQVHMGGDLVQYFFHRKHDGGIGGLRFDAFGITNHLGLIATAIFLVLLAISSDVAMRKLGLARWKTIQRWTYVVALLVIVHGFVYQALEGQKLTFVVLVVAVALTVAALQAFGFWRRREADKPSVEPASLVKARARGMKDGN
jgi:methionine sulfoxide reductase heme-binding subunit